MYAPWYTHDSKRIARLQSNYLEGCERESLPAEQRRTMDLTDLIVSESKLQELFQNAARLRSARRAELHQA